MKRIPRFKTQEQMARFWETHSFEDFHQDTRQAEIAFVKKPKRTVAIRMDPDDIKSVERIARRKGLSYTALLRMWIKEHLSVDTRRT